MLNNTEVKAIGKVHVNDKQKELSNFQTPHFYYVLPYNKSFIEESRKIKKNYLQTEDAIPVLFILFLFRCLTLYDSIIIILILFGCIFRKTHFYRSRVSQIIHNFRVHSRPYLNSTSPCVAVQLRRGDRALNIKEEDMFSYCYNVTHDLPCVGGFCNGDYCGDSIVPFSAIRLHHVVDKVPLLVMQ